ncbi:hypothetical protein PEL8287_02569 [Roseovarius litorisediminis]|uniref:Coenzyme PQQ synthesis protein D (PqqD) n=1 Tax=Roseovarius litorisediminis TaxID=1312363 RepID=A0A1Y5SV19_9RHOB|nr:PqqD family protein [Roseovarius litorisediminis]SLN49193.1 hypothetical protein PEL8287_02569 [Roseovarius litorisediminis]
MPLAVTAAATAAVVTAAVAPVVVLAVAPVAVQVVAPVVAPVAVLAVAPVVAPVAGAMDLAEAALAVDPMTVAVQVGLTTQVAPQIRQAALLALITSMGQTGHMTKKKGGAGDAPPKSDIESLQIVDIPHAVNLHDAPDVGRALDTVMPGWIHSKRQYHPTSPIPATTIRRKDDGSYDFRSRWTHRALQNLGLAGATCAVVADLSQAFCDAHPGTLGLHCGAVCIGGHLVALTGPYHAGKTTLVTRLATEQGISLFCDDILPVLPDGRAYSLGVQPRLRLPLPPKVTPEFHAFVDAHLTVRDKRYGFVDMPNLATRGSRAPLAGFVILSRKEGVAASLHQVDIAETASYLIRQNIADPGAVDTHFDQIVAMAENVVCLKLQYSDLEDAVPLIRDAFSGDKIPSPNIEIGPPCPPEPDEIDCKIADLHLVYQRNDLVIPRQIGSDTFLWQIEERNFYSLNQIAAAIWTLLETPATGLTIAGILQEAFPACEAEKIEKDTAELLGFMRSRNLVSVCDAS